MALLSLFISFPALIVSFFQLGGLPFDMAWVAIAICGIPIIKEAAEGLITSLDIKADVLVSIALVAAVAVGEVFAAGEVAFIMALGEYLEEKTVLKARAGIEKLVRQTPATARVLRHGEETVVPAKEVKVGELLRVLAGETVAVDGVIVKGRSSIDQSVMTGESLPVDKAEGDEVFSGTVNQFGTFDMRAGKVGEDSSLQRMIRLVESADAGKAKIVGVADRWATWIVVIALLSALGTWIVTREIIRSVTILVVFCPCALVLATPTAIMAGIGNATRHGILIREGDALERLAQVRHIAFDKTGTLTYGKPSVSQVLSVDSSLPDEALLELAAGAELLSEHPLGKAVVEDYKARCGASPHAPEEFRLLAGRGVYARVDGRTVLAGSGTFLNEYGVTLPDRLALAAEKAREDGSTVIFLSRDGAAVGMIALSDTVRPDAARMVKAIHGAGIQTLLLTGDGKQASSHIAEIAGIKNVRAECLPENKLQELRALEERGEPVCMVGDGINDAAALKAAYVGLAMGGIGSDIAIEAADAVLVGDEVKEIPHLLQLAKRTMRTIKVNLTASMTLNFIAIGLAMSGLLTPVLGALVHNLGSLAVVLNSAFLLHGRSTAYKQRTGTRY
jgi:heavy metal translocating P-type ATPase